MEFFEVIHTQRSIRRFKPDVVPEELLWEMLDAAIRGPSGSNSQPWRWIVVRDAAKRKEIAQAVSAWMATRQDRPALRPEGAQEPDASKRRTAQAAADFFADVSQAPVLVIPCLYQLTSPLGDAQHLLAGTSIYGAVQNMMLAARAQGLGTTLMTFQRGIEDTLRTLLRLPLDATPACVVPLGYPAEGQRFGPVTRKPVETVVYWDDWGRAKGR
ncbi:MAG: nitroreductase [Dehalococcoidia bacterium]|nr:nitroreductase [Dehalococcoidia bacterium]